MLVPTMTYEEAFCEVRKDWDWIRLTVAQLQVRFGKYVLKQTRYPAFYIYNRCSPLTNITYSFLCFVHRRGQWKLPYVLVHTTYEVPEGKNFILVTDLGTVRIYNAHFFQRYKQRASDKIAIPQLAELDPRFSFIISNYDVEQCTVMDGFLEQTTDQSLDRLKEKREWTKYQANEGFKREEYACADGVCLCEKSLKHEELVVFNTYISPDLLRFDQFVDYMNAFGHILLRKMEMVYPNQRDTWQKMYDDYYASLAEPDARQNWIERLKDLMKEFEERYPLPNIL